MFLSEHETHDDSLCTCFCRLSYLWVYLCQKRFHLLESQCTSSSQFHPSLGSWSCLLSLGLIWCTLEDPEPSSERLFIDCCAEIRKLIFIYMDEHLIYNFCLDVFGLFLDLHGFNLLGHLLLWFCAFKPLQHTSAHTAHQQWLLKLQNQNTPLGITYFALKELIVSNDQLVFLCGFGHVFYISQQLVLTEKLKEKKEESRCSDSSRVRR